MPLAAVEIILHKILFPTFSRTFSKKEEMKNERGWWEQDMREARVLSCAAASVKKPNSHNVWARINSN